MSDFSFTEKEYNTLLKKLDSIQEKSGVQLSPSEIIYDVSDALRIFKVSRRTLMEWRSSGKLSHHKIFGKIFFTQENFNEFLQHHAIKRFA